MDASCDQARREAGTGSSRWAPRCPSRAPASVPCRLNPALGLKAECPLERRIIDLCSEIPRTDARIVFLVEAGAITEQERSRRGLIRPHAFHQSGFAVGISAVDRNVTIEQFLDFCSATGAGGRAKFIKARVGPELAHWLGCVCP